MLAMMPTMRTLIVRPGKNPVTFGSDGETLRGDLYLPPAHEPGRKLAAIVITGSLTSVKEQMAGLYGRMLADEGFVTLAFDYRNFGESTGEPRQYESPRQHVADIRNAVSFLQTVATVDPDRIAALGVCTGGAYMSVATAEDARIKAYAGVVPHVGSADANRLLYGGDEGVRARREAGRRAAARYGQEHVVDYILAYSNKGNDPMASHSQPGGMEYYFDATRGYMLAWTNRFALMSWEEWLDFAPIDEADRIHVPSLVISGDKAALPQNAKALFEKIGTTRKRLIWTSLAHFDFYDRAGVPLAVAEVRDHFRAALSTSQVTAETTSSP
jgi:fermentation-respiration switch protein FrsA (DUF1100 family)